MNGHEGTCRNMKGHIRTGQKRTWTKSRGMEEHRRKLKDTHGHEGKWKDSFGHEGKWITCMDIKRKIGTGRHTIEV